MPCRSSLLDLARGAGALDVGWLLGELVELEEAARRGLGSAPDAGWHDDLLAYLDLIAELLDARPMPHDVDELEV